MFRTYVTLLVPLKYCCNNAWRQTIFCFLSLLTNNIATSKSCRKYYLVSLSGLMNQCFLGTTDGGSNGTMTFDIVGDIGSGRTLKRAVPFMATVRE